MPRTRVCVFVLIACVAAVSARAATPTMSPAEAKGYAVRFLDHAGVAAWKIDYALHRAEAYEELAAVQQRMADSAAAQVSLEQARGAIDTEMPSSLKAEAYLHLTDLYVQRGQMAAAKALVAVSLPVAASLKEGDDRCKPLMKLALWQTWYVDAATAGATFELAKKAVNEASYFKEFDQSELVHYLIAAGRRDEAKMIAAQIKDDFHADNAWAELAHSQAVAGDASGARDSRSHIQRKTSDEDMQAARVAAEIEAGNLRAADAHARAIKNFVGRSWALADVVEAKLNAGDVNGGADTAALIEESDRAVSADSQVAIAQMRAGNVDAARRSAAKAAAEAEDVDGWSEESEAHWRAGEAQVIVGDNFGASASFWQARRAANHYVGPPENADSGCKWELLGRIAASQAQMNDLDAAKATLAMIDLKFGDDDRTKACRALGRAIATFHDTADAARWIDALPAERERCLASIGAAESFLGRANQGAMAAIGSPRP